MNFKLQTVHRNIHPKKGRQCLCEAQTHDLHVAARRSTDNTMSNSFYSVFLVLIIYSQQVSIFMKPPCSNYNCFCSTRKKRLSVWGSNSQPWCCQHACNIYPRKKSCLYEVQLMTFTLQHDALPHRSWPRMYVPRGSKGNKLLTLHKWTSWERDYVGLAQAHPNSDYQFGLAVWDLQRHYHTRLLVRQRRGLRQTHTVVRPQKHTYVCSKEKTVMHHTVLTQNLELLRPLHCEESYRCLTAHIGEQAAVAEASKKKKQ